LRSWSVVRNAITARVLHLGYF